MAKWFALAAIVLAASPLNAQLNQGPPADLERVGLEQHLDAALPLEIEFRDERGKAVRLGDYFEGERPVLLALVYYRCPMLCNLVLEGLVDTLQQIEWAPGGEFDIVAVSIDSRETPTLAQDKKQSTVAAYGRPETAAGWHFLTGPAASVERLAETVGFRYEFLPEQNEFAHPAAIYLVTPEGRLSRYLIGVRHEPRDLRMALYEAGEGKIGSVVDQFLLYCYRYDAAAGVYTPFAWRLMRAGGLATLIILGSAIFFMMRREPKRAVS